MGIKKVCMLGVHNYRRESDTTNFLANITVMLMHFHKQCPASVYRVTQRIAGLLVQV